MDKFANTISLAGWSFLMFHIGIQLVFDREGYITSDLTLDVNVLRFVQTFQLCDIFLILIGKSKGSIMGALAQITGRLVVAWIFISPQSDHLKFAMVVILWSLADVNRYLFYLFKDNKATILLRYNSFILLYPIGVYGEMLVINDFIKRKAQTLSDQQITIIRVIQFTICIGMVFLYVYMLSSRKRQMQRLNQGQLPKEENVQRSRSPRAKRD